jgi:hypothetical protein
LFLMVGKEPRDFTRGRPRRWPDGNSTNLHILWQILALEAGKPTSTVVVHCTSYRHVE